MINELDFEMFDVGMYGGSFNPLHNGHIKCINKALFLCKELHIIIGETPNMDDVDIDTKLSWFYTVFNSKKEKLVFHTLYDDRTDKTEYTLEKWKRDSKIIKEMIGKPIDAVFCGMDYRYKDPNPYKLCYPGQTIIYFGRGDHISSSEFRKNPEEHKDWVPEIVYKSYERE